MSDHTTPTSARAMLSAGDFAKLLGIGRRTFQTWRAAGKLPLPDLRIGHTVRWRASTVEAWLADQTGGAA